MRTSGKVGLVAAAMAAVAASYAATVLQRGAAVNVSQTPSPTEKAKVVRLAYQDGAQFKKAWLFTYGDGPVGRQNVFVKYSFDEGATWSAPVLLSRDAANGATGGQSILTKDALMFVADNDKPNIFAPPVTSGPHAVVTWASGYCPENPAATNNAGSYSSALQGAGDLNEDGQPDRPFNCVWTATTTDPSLATWDVQQITNGERDAIGEVVNGNATGTAFALAWQEDPAGLRPGEAEGPGDGGSGATVHGGTNIWYTHAPTPDGATFRANVAKVSDNNTLGTGQPGASRPNLQISGGTAVLAYEETACPGSSGGKCIVYHSFPFAKHDTDASGTILSDVTRTARRVRFVLQGATAAGTSNLRTVVLWRESPTVAPGAPADIVIRRGLVDPVARPGSTGYLASDILADTPQQMTNLAASGGNANAHRAIVRGGLVVLAYDQTPDMVGADPDRTATPTANYNLFVTRSTTDGSPGSWSVPLNLSQIASPAHRVVEPRLVPTPGTIVNPLTGMADAGDTQDTNVLYVAFATESNSPAGTSGRVYLSRSSDQGASFEPFVPVSDDTAGQSEAQLRASPDGTSVSVLWMAEQTSGDVDTKDAMFTTVASVQVPDLNLGATGVSFEEERRGAVTLTILNEGTGAARNVALSGSVPAELTPVSITGLSGCAISGATFSCAIPELLAGQSVQIALKVSGFIEGSYSIDAAVSSDGVEFDLADNQTTATVTVTHNGSGCTMARGDTPFDPSLPLLAALGLAGLALRRVGASRSPP
ncbi:choice-of-anchor O protein [uncultured Piscinibacter sp.]|uniref:choice-of-anchor O protein n=1 Tax=uncultured Piscinibacter sp. TaxID=1131835 RepID=UPI002608A394|nr:choice-of-anchor O protein [uncultured Piscinibacter sp.]